MDVRAKTMPQHFQEFIDHSLMPNAIGMKFRAGGRDEFLSIMESAMKTEAWLRPIAVVEQKQIKVEGYGIRGIKRALNEDTKDRSQALSSGFKDLRSLVDNAKQLKGLASKLKQMEENKDPELEEIRASMVSLGFTSGVTKETAGKNYISQLAREICDFIKEPLETSGGLLPLLDAFCLYNRSRGGNPISAIEMNQACELFDSLQLPVKIRTLNSGAKALQLGSQAMERLTGKIVEKVRENDHLSAKETAELFRLSSVIALECLLIAEKQGALCRDQGLQGLHFYSNLFLDH